MEVQNINNEYQKSKSFSKKFSDNFWIIVTGICAFTIIALVIYLLVYIFVLGKSSISWEFLTQAPAEGLTKGGIFPCIVGTALLVIIMSVAGVPIGTITAIYLTEYAKENSILSKSIRFAVNTLAGVPAIVFGLFGLGFFIATLGRGVDNIEQNNKIQNMEKVFNIDSSPLRTTGKASAEQVKQILIKDGKNYWDEQIDLTKTLAEMYPNNTMIDKNVVIQFYKDRNRPKWGQPSILWAALTMALLTLPVVIVSVEEAIRTVPRDLREASLALGATKFMTIVKVVLPGSMTGILTGAILAVSRGAGEVAPILFVGAAYFLPNLPTSLNSQFMELGYHIYILTTQSTNVDATKPLLYATTLVLLSLTFILNFSAIFLRSRVRAKMTRQGN